MKYIAYYRVSTQKQGSSGLGLEAQKRDVDRFTGGNILNEYTDIESGKKNDRPELEKAIGETKKLDVTLVIAKLDRLSRNLTFISSLMDSGIKFKCCDMPEANEFTIHIFAALAQQERKLISKRTKSALQSLKEKGVVLGKPENLTVEARQKAVLKIKENALNNQANRQASELINFYRNEGDSFREIARKLNELGYRTRYGNEFKAMSVKRLLGNIC